MALSKADYEKALGRTLSDEDFAKLSGASMASGTRAAAPDAPDASRSGSAFVANPGQPMLAEAKKAAKGAKPVEPQKGSGTITFLANTRQGEREIKENITSPADVDKYVAAGMITPEEGAKYKADKWPAPKPPQAGIVGKGTLVGNTISATPPAKPQPQPLQTLVKSGPGMGVTAEGDYGLYDGAPKVSGPPTPLFQAATAPPAPQPYASGMTVQPEQDEYGAVIAAARKKWGL